MDKDEGAGGKATPGPWDAGGGLVIRAGTVGIAEVVTCTLADCIEEGDFRDLAESGPAYDEAAANAALIASAPALLAFVESVARECADPKGDRYAVMEALALEASNLLASARGGK